MPSTIPSKTRAQGSENGINNSHPSCEHSGSRPSVQYFANRGLFEESQRSQSQPGGPPTIRHHEQPLEALNHAPSALEARRKTLSQVAFVRNNGDLRNLMRASDGGAPSERRGERQSLTAPVASRSSLSGLPTIQQGSLSNRPSFSGLGRQQRISIDNLNGIGHPIVSPGNHGKNGMDHISHRLNDSMVSSSEGMGTRGKLFPSIHKAGSNRNTLNQANLGSPHHHDHRHDHHHEPHGSSTLPGSGSHAMKRIDTLPGSRTLRPQEPPQPSSGLKGPLGPDSLNLWKGKRLTRLEMKVEQRLHVVRNNPVAKNDLQERVYTYKDDKMHEQAERVAIAELAAERREQKELQFAARIKGPKASEPTSSSNSMISSLFDSATGNPRMDPNPLPNSSKAFWKGFICLGQKLRHLKVAMEAYSENKKQMAVKSKAASVIQAHWRGYRSRCKFDEMLAKKGRFSAMRSTRKGARQSAAAIEMEQAAASEAVLHFIHFVRERGVLEYLKQLFRAQGEIEGTVAYNTRKANNIEFLRYIRVRTLIQQWQSVEAACILCIKKRQRSSMIGEPPPRRSMPGNVNASKAPGLAALMAQKKNISGTSEDDPESKVKAAVSTALTQTFLTDRIVLEDLSPVPEPVKMAVVQIFLRDRLRGYTQMMGLHWQARARYKVEAREGASRAMAKKLLRYTTLHVSQKSKSKDDDRDEEEDADEGADEEQRSREPDPESDLPQDPGRIPRFRTFATIKEIRAIMQQGVAETPYYNAYVAVGKLQAYEKELAKQLAETYAEHDESTLKALAKKGKAARVVKGSNGTNPSMAAKAIQGADILDSGALSGEASTTACPKGQDEPAGPSFTLTKLMHRWHTEGNPRVTACLNKRFEQMHTDLVTCQIKGLWLPHNDMGIKLMELREG